MGVLQAAAGAIEAETLALVRTALVQAQHSQRVGLEAQARKHGGVIPI
jgi:hypothetical protein